MSVGERDKFFVEIVSEKKSTFGEKTDRHVDEAMVDKKVSFNFNEKAVTIITVER